MTFRTPIAILLYGLTLSFSHPLITAAASTWEVVLAGLDNPRGLAFGPEGALYIAQAGSGGNGPCGPGPEGTRCYGDTGAITRYTLRDGNVTDVVTGLPSLATQEGQMFAIGPNDLSFQGRGNLFFTVGFGGDPRTRGIFGPTADRLAHTARATPDGTWRLLADLGTFEAQRNPTGDEIDSNPYGILALAGKQVVTDAGANALLEVRQNGRIVPLATFPDRLVDAPPFLGLPPGTRIPMDTVPTSVALGPDGNYYVGQLTGFPFPVGGANIYRVPATGGTPEVFATGFTHIIDLVFGRDGSLYVLEIAKNGLLAAFQTNDWTGALIRIAPDGTRTELVPGVLTAPGGIAVGKDGALYVTNNSIYSDIGEVIRIRP
jgi:DNA-binding beta-propeller fold protein YncE